MAQDVSPGDGVLDTAQARRMLARAMVALGRAPDPEATFRQLEDVIFVACKVLGPGHPSVQGLRRMGLKL